MNPSSVLVSQPSLSIAIPTLNRCQLLGETLRILCAQLVEAETTVELLVSDNASTDGTPGLFQPGAEFAAVAYHRHEDKVGIEESFRRTINLTSGTFVLLFGDDDVPLPGFLREITRTLRNQPEIALLYVNRLIGDMTLEDTREIAHIRRPFGEAELMRIGDFVERFTHWPGFVSSLVFARRIWEAGVAGYSDRFDGYAFLGRVYWGSQGCQAGYLPAPLLIQRRGVLAWKRDWPRYWLISMPRMLAFLDAGGVTTHAVDSWRTHDVTTLRFAIDCFVAKAYGYPARGEFWAESRSYQTSRVRRAISWLAQWLLPVWVARMLYARSPKMT